MESSVEKAEERDYEYKKQVDKKEKKDKVAKIAPHRVLPQE